MAGLSSPSTCRTRSLVSRSLSRTPSFIPQSAVLLRVIATNTSVVTRSRLPVPVVEVPRLPRRRSLQVLRRRIHRRLLRSVHRLFPVLPRVPRPAMGPRSPPALPRVLDQALLRVLDQALPRVLDQLLFCLLLPVPRSVRDLVLPQAPTPAAL